MVEPISADRRRRGFSTVPQVFDVAWAWLWLKHMYQHGDLVNGTNTSNLRSLILSLKLEKLGLRRCCFCCFHSRGQKVGTSLFSHGSFLFGCGVFSTGFNASPGGQGEVCDAEILHRGEQAECYVWCHHGLPLHPTHVAMGFSKSESVSPP